MQQQQQQQAGQQQPLMQQPPQVITSKDLAYLTDQMSWQLTVMKKYHHFAQECMDPEVKAALDQAGQMHSRHYQMLLKHCQHNNTQVMQSIPQPSQNQQHMQ
ncbi:hypothetical protein J2S00_000548 [Caldalkalibacillus uzonensis]|uniref:Ferritin-like domain-containing protein n=1 Tax=Caldalkalibacillus uzonensis TaxID=353224 RepID=A0ABU0CMY4_9BACI|nr:hypothetical protein [Caldalkalibacillus uzonensis]MDQ0337778.1 hypothetical protein [Caldalkalibacillus uzonensis]